VRNISNLFFANKFYLTLSMYNFGVDAEEVWQIIHNSLPELETQLKKISTTS